MPLRLVLSSLILAGLTLANAPLAAIAEADTCALLTNDQERLDCDARRATTIAAKGERLFGQAPQDWLRIVDTVSPSGASYVYYVFEEGPYLLLEARSVPRADADGKAPACRLRTALPLDIATQVKAAAAAIVETPPEGYGAREAASINPDGSRTIRLILDSHDIITRIKAGDDNLNFSRLAAGEDTITELNNLVIGVANFSGDWSCDAV